MRQPSEKTAMKWRHCIGVGENNWLMSCIINPMCSGLEMSEKGAFARDSMEQGEVNALTNVLSHFHADTIF